MDQANLNIQMDADIKKRFEEFCADIGMNVTEIINLFAKTVVSERKIPFAVVKEPSGKTEETSIEQMYVANNLETEEHEQCTNLVKSLFDAMNPLPADMDHNDLIAKLRLENYSSIDWLDSLVGVIPPLDDEYNILIAQWRLED